MQAASEFGSHLPQLRLHPLANRLSQQEEAWVGFFTNDFLKKVALAGGTTGDVVRGRDPQWCELGT